MRYCLTKEAVKALQSVQKIDELMKILKAKTLTIDADENSDFIIKSPVLELGAEFSDLKIEVGD